MTDVMNTSNSRSNLSMQSDASDSAFSVPPYIFHGMLVINGLVALLGIMGNIFVCLIIIKGRKMYTVANLFLMNLAIADMFILVVSYPLWIVRFLLPFKWPFGSVLCKIIPPVSDAFYGVSLGCMMAISMHRYRMIIHVMQAQLSFRHARLIIILIWLVSLASISAPLYPVMEFVQPTIIHNITIGNSTKELVDTFTMCETQWPTWSYEKYYNFFLAIAWYIIPLLLILCTFVRIKVFLKKQLYNYNESQGIATHVLGIKKALRMLAPVVITFGLMMLPHVSLRLLTVFKNFHEIAYSQIYLLIAVSMLVANSVINPFIYYITSREFRLEFQKQFWLLKNSFKFTHKDDKYVLQPDKNGKVYVRRVTSYNEIIRKNKNPRKIRKLRYRTDTQYSDITVHRNEHKFSNGAPTPNYDEIFNSYVSGEYSAKDDFRNARTLTSVEEDDFVDEYNEEEEDRILRRKNGVCNKYGGNSTFEEYSLTPMFLSNNIWAIESRETIL